MIIPKQQTNAFFKKERNHAQNKVCLECNSKSPVYTNLTLSCYLCSSCAGIHRSLYKIKSTIHDNWVLVELKRMFVGGNVFAMEKGILNFEDKELKEYISFLDEKVLECLDNIFDVLEEKKIDDFEVEEVELPKLGVIYDKSMDEIEETENILEKKKETVFIKEPVQYKVKKNEYSFVKSNDTKYNVGDVEEERLGFIGEFAEKTGKKNESKYSYKNVLYRKTIKEEKTDYAKNVKNIMKNVTDSGKSALSNLISKFKK
ncbi:hypothetical protein GVAV_002624 [Gurleya vavrai]